MPPSNSMSRNAGAFALRGAVLLRLQDATGAKRDAEAALEIDPLNAAALMFLLPNAWRAAIFRARC